MYKQGVYMMFLKMVEKCPKRTGKPDYNGIEPPLCHRCIVYRSFGVKCKIKSNWAELVKARKEAGK